MQNKSHYRLIVSFFLIWPVFIGCYSFIGRWDPPFYGGEDQHYFEKLIYRNQSQLDGHFNYRLASDNELRVVGADPQVKAEALNAPLLLRFAWVSDVHIRQPEVKLFSKNISRTLDDVIPSFEHNAVQEDFHWAVYLSLIEATNRLHGDRPLDFMIHTGDGIDAGTIEELYQFVYISDQLRIPWLNLVGNHDVSIFGNYQERIGYTRQAGVNFYPVGNLSNFGWMHRRERVISGFGRHLLPTPAESGHSPSEDTWIGKKLPPTYHHGFDFGSGRTCRDSPPQTLDYDRVTGDYAADLCGIPVPVRLIALNSAIMDEWGAGGRITPEQRGWLQRALLPPHGGINLMFVHHRPQEFDAETQALLVGPDHGALVVFTGHTHQHHLKQEAGPNGCGYYELNTGSVLEFPQIGRLIELRGTPGGAVWLVSRALWSSPMAVQEMPPDTEIEAVLKECLKEREAKREILADAVRCGHYGAYDDYRKDKEHIWGRPQPFAEAWSAANVIVPVSR